jgi:hypothetical protein
MFGEGEPMESEFAERDRSELDRLRTLSASLSDDALRRPIDSVWSAAALFAHLAFWDRLCRARWLHAARTGRRTPAPFEDDLLELINDANLSHWAAIPPRIAVEECLEAAEAVDALIRSLEAAVVSEVLAEGRRRLVDRSIHRREHLGMIETAFPSS